MRTKNGHDKNEYNRKNREMKVKVKEKKCIVDERCCESFSRNFREKKKLY